MSDVLSSDVVALIDFVLRSTLLVAVAGIVAAIMRASGVAAASRHIVWLSAFGVIALLPLLNEVLPQITIPWPRALAIGTPDLSVPGPHLPPNNGPALFWPLCVYFLGVSLLLARLAIAVAALEALWRRAVPADRDIDLSSLAAKAGTRGQVSLRFADAPIAPVTWGRRILLPNEAKDWSPKRQCEVVLHELCHVARYDSTTLLAVTIVRALFWFNPALWIAHRALRRELEQAADDRVLVCGTDPRSYAQTLIDVAARVGQATGNAAVSTAIVRRSDLEVRVRAILAPSSRSASKSAVPLSIAGFAAAAFVAMAHPVDRSARLAPLAPLQGSLDAITVSLVPLQSSR